MDKMGNNNNKNKVVGFSQSLGFKCLVWIGFCSYMLVTLLMGYSIILSVLFMLKYLKAIFVMLISLDFTNYINLMDEIIKMYINYKISLLKYIVLFTFNILLCICVISLGVKEIFDIFFKDLVSNLKDSLLIINKCFKSVYFLIFGIIMLLIGYFMFLSFEDFLLGVFIFILFYLLVHIIEGVHIILEDYIYSKYVVIVCKSILVMIHSGAMILLWVHFI